MVELASRSGACVAQITRENGVNDNVIFKWLHLWQNEGRVSHHLKATMDASSSSTYERFITVVMEQDSIARIA